MIKHMLTVTNLTKKFGRVSAVDGVSFSVKPGEIYALIGPNGSGKTTIIKLIVGLLRPTGGSMSVGMLDVTKEPEHTKAMIGYIPDEPAVWPAMTGEEFLHFSGALYGVEEKARLERIPQLLAAFRIGGIGKEYFENYSRGNKQKLSILAALLHEPKLLLIDEPIVGLDPESAEIAKQKFKEFAKAGGAVLLVTHTLSVAEEIADAIGLLREGKLIATGTLNNLRSRAGLGGDASLESVYMALTREGSAVL